MPAFVRAWLAIQGLGVLYIYVYSYVCVYEFSFFLNLFCFVFLGPDSEVLLGSSEGVSGCVIVYPLCPSWHCLYWVYACMCMLDAILNLYIGLFVSFSACILCMYMCIFWGFVLPNFHDSCFKFHVICPYSRLPPFVMCFRAWPVYWGAYLGSLCCDPPFQGGHMVHDRLFHGISVSWVVAFI